MDFNSGSFVGDSEGMYREIDDPWCQGEAMGANYQVILSHLERLLDSHSFITDFGCGKGALSNRILESLTSVEYLGLDISGTAIELPRENCSYSDNAKFMVENFLNASIFTAIPSRPKRLVIVIDICWYLVLEKLLFQNSLAESLGGNIANTAYISLTF